MNNTLRIVHAYEKPRVNRRAVIFAAIAGFMFVKYVEHIDNRVIKLEKEIKALKEKEDSEELDKDILEEDFLK